MWADLLRQAVKKRGLRTVGRELGYSATALSQALNGRYSASTDRLEARVLEELGQVDCPHLGTSIPRAECETAAIRPTPTSNPQALRHWAACQACPLRPIPPSSQE